MADVRPGGTGYRPGWTFLAFIAALAILKGLRMPNRWSVTHYLFNYQTGFMKRALWGDLLWRVFGNWTSHYFFMAGVALAVLALLLALLAIGCRRLPDGPDRLPYLLVFAASPAISFAVHLAGYLEQIAYVAVVVVILQRRRWLLQVAVALACAVFLPAVHEGAIFWAAALCMLAVVAGEPARAHPVRARFGAAVAIAVVWTASTLAVLNNGKVSAERADAIREERTAFADTRPRQDAFQTLTVPLEASLADMRQRWTDRNLRFEMALSLGVFGPSMIFLGALALGRTRSIDGTGVVRLVAGALVAGAILSPLAMHAVGWDMHRWNALAALNAGLAALILLMAPDVSRASGATSTTWFQRHALGLAMALSIWNLTSDPTFFDEYGPSHPPFQYRWLFLRDAVATPDWNSWVPRPGN